MYGISPFCNSLKYTLKESVYVSSVKTDDKRLISNEETKEAFLDISDGKESILFSKEFNSFFISGIKLEFEFI